MTIHDKPDAARAKKVTGEENPAPVLGQICERPWGKYQTVDLGSRFQVNGSLYRPVRNSVFNLMFTGVSIGALSAERHKSLLERKSSCLVKMRTPISRLVRSIGSATRAKSMW